MKRLFFLFISILLSSIIFAQTNPDLESYLLENDEAFVKIKIDSEEDIYKLSRYISIEDYDSEHRSIYITDNNLYYFEKFDFEYEILQHPSSLIKVQMFDGTKETYEWDSYPTYETYISIMEQFAADYPDICQVFSIGESEEGRELKFVKISDNVGEKEAEPQFMYTGTMHGDETAGFVLLLRLIDYLTENYGTDDEVTQMVNNLEIWINPAANPDGTYHSGNHTVNGSTRGNANGVNLNRNYKCPVFGDHADENSWQAETIAFMALAQENNFTMSANTHGGAEVINYPWDIWSRASADDDWWVYVSREYADTAHTFAPSNYMTGFENGITRGYEWYPIFGGRQDFMNYFHHCREVTIEMSDIKLLAESELEKHWTYNKRSLINYMKQCMYGVHGIVTDSITGETLEAEIYIEWHDEDESQVYSHPETGFYARLLKGGYYDLSFNADGYISKTIDQVQVQDYQTTILDVQLVNQDWNSIEELTSSDVKIYPNPVQNNRVYIESIDKINRIFLYDMAGNLLKSWHTTNADQSLNTDGLKKGTYIIQVNTSSISYHQKLIISGR